MSNPSDPACLSSLPPTEKEWEILNNELLKAYSESDNAINLIDELKKGNYLDWELKDTDAGKVLVPCIKDKNGNIVEHDMLRRQFRGSSHMLKFIVPFCELKTWALTPSAIAKSNARLNDQQDGPLSLKPDCRQEFGIDVTNNADGVSEVYDELSTLTTIRAAEALIKAKGPDFERFTGDPKLLAKAISDKHNSLVYAWPQPPKTTTGPNGEQVESKMLTFRTTLLQGRKPAPGNMDPEESHLSQDQKSSSAQEFTAYSDDDKSLIRSALKNANGSRKFTPIQIVLPDNTIGSSAYLRSGCVGAAVVGIGNINFNGRGGGVFVRKCHKIFVFRNGPTRDNSERPVFDATAFVKSKLSGSETGNAVGSSIKRDIESDDDEDIAPAFKKSKPSPTAKIDDHKKRLANKRTIDSDDEDTEPPTKVSKASSSSKIDEVRKKLAAKRTRK